MPLTPGTTGKAPPTARRRRSQPRDNGAPCRAASAAGGHRRAEALRFTAASRQGLGCSGSKDSKRASCSLPSPSVPSRGAARSHCCTGEPCACWKVRGQENDAEFCAKAVIKRRKKKKKKQEAFKIGMCTRESRLKAGVLYLISAGAACQPLKQTC